MRHLTTLVPACAPGIMFINAAWRRGTSHRCPGRHHSAEVAGARRSERAIRGQPCARRDRATDQYRPDRRGRCRRPFRGGTNGRPRRRPPGAPAAPGPGHRRAGPAHVRRRCGRLCGGRPRAALRHRPDRQRADGDPALVRRRQGGGAARRRADRAATHPRGRHADRASAADPPGRRAPGADLRAGTERERSRSCAPAARSGTGRPGRGAGPPVALPRARLRELRRARRPRAGPVRAAPGGARAPEAREPAAAGAVTVVVRVKGVAWHRFVVTEAAPVAVGRAPDEPGGVGIGLALDEQGLRWVSRSHVRFDLRGTALQVTDTSTNGTSVLVRSGPAESARRAQLNRGEGTTLGDWDAVELYEDVELGRADRAAGPVAGAPTNSVMTEAPTQAMRLS